ncbi:MAG: sialidase family protein, partial [Kiritimatiellales bacterium]
LGGIAEVIVYSRALNTNEISAVHDYLSAKFDIPITAVAKVTSDDPRFFRNGTLMLDSAYIDQPYIVKRADQWLAVATRSDISEAGSDRRLAILNSTNAGATWSERVNAPETNRMPSWGTLLQTPSGRVYCFYNMNRLPGEGVGVWYAYRYSDDWGTSWSSRYTLPVRETWHEKTFRQYRSWGIDDPVIAGDTVYLSFTKRDQGSATQQGEGFVFKSTNILTEANAQNIRWEMLPAGDYGIKLSEYGPIQEEHNIESLGGDDLYCAFRTLEGYIGESYSTNGGTTWTEPGLISDVTGRKIKNPRACAMVWRCENGKYLLWSHNNDGRQVSIRNKDRSLVWLRGGIYKEGRIQWSQPEPALFTCAPFHYIGLSYPDLAEDNGRYYISATDKQQARLCEVSTNLLENLWNQESLCEFPSTGLIYDSSGTNTAGKAVFDLGDRGFTVTCTGNPGANNMLWSALDKAGNGASVRMTADGKAAIGLRDHHMRQPWIWETDEPVSTSSTVSFIVDGAANWVYVAVDGKLCDGGTNRAGGFGPLPYQMDALTEYPVGFESGAARVFVHQRILSVSETIGMHRAISVLKK